MILTLTSLLITIYIIGNTYAIFESEISGEKEVEKAKWTILVNRTNISNGIVEEFTIDQINVQGSETVEEGKLAPGLSGNFNIEIDPSDTDVSIKYEINFDLTNLENTKIKIDSIIETQEGNNLIKTGENTYTGIITLSDIQKGVKNNITINFSWDEDETTGEEDTAIGKIENGKINIPVKVKVLQYLGEEITEIASENKLVKIGFIPQKRNEI